MKIVITEFMDESALHGFSTDMDVHYDPELVHKRDELLERAAEADALIVRNLTQVDQALLDAAPQLRVVGRLGVGLDNIDMTECRARGITVCPATGANTKSVAEYVIATALMLRRGAYMANAAMLAGEWPRSQLIGRELSGATLGLVGYGGIARAVAGLAKTLGMSVIASDPGLPVNDSAWQDAGRRFLNDLLAEADVVSIHVPLNHATKGMINARALQSMKPGSVLINTSRGGIVDEAALAGVLWSKHLAGAALDVFEAEPLSADAASVFANVPNLILTPHIAGVTEEANTRVSQVTVENVIAALAESDAAATA